MYLLIIFFTSFAALVAMIWYRKWEIEFGKAEISHSNEKPFFPIQEITEEIKKCYNRVPRENILLFFHKSRKRGMQAVFSVLKRIEHVPIKKRIYSIIDAVRGRQDIQTNGRPASPFIKDILAHKEQFRQKESGEEQS